MPNKILKKIKKHITNKKNVSPISKYVRAVDARKKAVEEAFKGNF
tara:strand:- start:39 stop:173 length:135 start_codon:yes stop_codon:yes gene_type:complete